MKNTDLEDYKNERQRYENKIIVLQGEIDRLNKTTIRFNNDLDILRK